VLFVFVSILGTTVIAFLQGELLSKNLRSVIVNVQGVGYQVFMPITDLSTFSALGTQVKLHIHTCVREDALDLFGFLSLEKKTLFENLISVSGIGPKTALAMLSGMEPQDFAGYIANADIAALTSVPGVGPKTAQRLVLELTDRLKNLTFGASKPESTRSTLDDLRSAVLNLGYKAPLVEKAIKAVEPLAKDGQTLQQLVKEALRHLN
jgi:Holliday junction DNA helicase RuvA